MKKIARYFILLLGLVSVTACMEYNIENDLESSTVEAHSITLDGEKYYIKSEYSPNPLRLTITEGEKLNNAWVHLTGYDKDSKKQLAIAVSIHYDREKGITGNYIAKENAEGETIFEHGDYDLLNSFYNLRDTESSTEDKGSKGKGTFYIEDKGNKEYNVKFDFEYKNGKRAQGNITGEFSVE
ncbi:hypothetical protein [Vaginella massiliensis]|uniref:hypothetical protein n=1 Tax=Vaginella massiliensis TaxID=1816680 RepID=UPI0012B5F823|nr:hypothetical protein [Vaginella massiliensis]